MNMFKTRTTSFFTQSWSCVKTTASHKFPLKMNCRCMSILRNNRTNESMLFHPRSLNGKSQTTSLLMPNISNSQSLIRNKLQYSYSINNKNNNNHNNNNNNNNNNSLESNKSLLTLSTKKIHTNNNNNTKLKRNVSNVIISKRNQSYVLEHSWGLVFLGAPGVGKGTYSNRIAKEFNAKILSSGDLIRECAKQNAGTSLGDSLTEYIRKGQLVPDDIVLPMVIDYLRMLPSTFILDGFPRTLNQAKRIDSEYGFHCVVHFKLPDHILMKKILGRRVCTNCNANFNIAHIDEGEIHMPSMAPKVDGICDNCGHELSVRPDDTEETIKERMKIFHAQTGPIERYYKESGILIEHDIKKGIDDLPEIIQKMKNFLENFQIEENVENNIANGRSIEEKLNLMEN